MDIRDHNRRAWDRQVESGNEWTVPVVSGGDRRAPVGASGRWCSPRSSPCRTTGLANLTELRCAVSGLGRRSAGPDPGRRRRYVVSYDNSPRQLEQDRLVAERDGLDLQTVEGDMRDLSAFADRSFDLIFHPVSNLFVPEIRPVWREAFRVLRPGGALLAGFINPLQYIFDWGRAEKGELVVRHRVPYSDLTSVTEEERGSWIEGGDTLEFGHTLEDQIAGQLEAGFVLTGFYEDYDKAHPLAKFIASFIATRALRPAGRVTYVTASPAVGEAAPDAVLRQHGGGTVQLAHAWQGGNPALLVFLRHLG